MSSLSNRTFSFWAFWITTGFLALSQAGAGMLYFVADAPADTFAALGFGDAFRWLLGAAKLIGAGLLVAPVARFLKEWAYVGFALTFSLAILAHTMAGDPAGSLWAPGISLGVLILSYVLFRMRRADAQDGHSPGTMARLLWSIAGMVGLVLVWGAGRTLYIIYGGGHPHLEAYASDAVWIGGAVAVVVVVTVGLSSLYHMIHRSESPRSAPSLMQRSLSGLLALIMAALGVGALVAAYGHPLIETVSALGVPPYMLIVIGVAKITAAVGLVLPLPRAMKEWVYFGTLATAVAAAWLSAWAQQPIQDILVPLGVMGLWSGAYGYAHLSTLRLSNTTAR